MDPEFEKNIKKLLGDDFGHDEHFDEGDLNAELEAIMNGHSGKPNRQNKPVKVQAKKQKTSPSLNVSDPTLDINQIQRMLNGFDIENSKDYDDDVEVDENDLMQFLGQMDSPMEEEPAPISAPSRPAPPLPTPLIPERPTENRQSSNTKIDPVPFQEARVVPSEVILPSSVKEQSLSKIERVKALQLEYKKAALKAKNDGNKQQALTYLRQSKEIDSLITKLQNNEDVDLQTLPPSLENTSTSQKQASSSSQASSGNTVSNIENNTFQIDELPEVSQETAAELFNAPKSASTIMEALEQRLQKYKTTRDEAKASNNDSKARRLDRIVKQYESAIKTYKAGKPIDLDSLVPPPGFPPFPKEDNGSAPQPSNKTPIPQAQSKPVPSKVSPTQQPEAVNQKDRPIPNPVKPAAKPQTHGQRGQLKRGTSTTGDKQLRFLIERQKLFKQAALEAYKRKEVEQAKEYMKQAKGFDPLIEATMNGLPIEVTSIPVPPQIVDNDFVIVDETEVPAINPVDNSKFYSPDEREELFQELERDLLSQIDMCNRNKEFFIKMGDSQNSKKFEQFALNSRKDLTMLRVRWKNGDNVPSFKYETRTYSCVVANSDVGTDVLYVEILNGIDIPGRPEIDTYVKVEFNFPSTVNGTTLNIWACFKSETDPEKAQMKKTKTIYNTKNPEYKEILVFDIQRESKSLPRILKRHPLKVELYSRGGFLRSDSKIGTVLIDLKDLDKKCTIHDCFSLTDGKKPLQHGKLEVRIKIREPLLSKQIEEIKERWIVFT